MSNTNSTPEAIEQLLDRVSSASERLATVNATLLGQGARTRITHPEGGAPVVP